MDAAEDAEVRDAEVLRPPGEAVLEGREADTGRAPAWEALEEEECALTARRRRREAIADAVACRDAFCSFSARRAFSR